MIERRFVDLPPGAPREHLREAGRGFMRSAGLLAVLVVSALILWAAPSASISPAHLAVRGGALALEVGVQATSITPITATTDPASGFVYSGESYNVACNVAGGSVTLYPAVHDGTRWQVFQALPCTLTSATAAEGTCAMAAPLQGTGLTWNVLQMGAGTLSSCTASARSGPAPVSRAPPASGPGSGTVTSIECLTGLVCTPDPITATGTIAPDFGTAAGTVVQGGVVVGTACVYPTSVTYNDAGQVTACSPGTAPVSAPAPAIVASLTGFGVSQVFVTSATASSTGSTSSGAALPVFAPAGSVWQMRTAITTAITLGQTCDVFVKSSTTPAGARSNVLSGTYANVDGANSVKLTTTYTVGGSLVWLAVSALCSFAYGGLIFFQLERVS